MDSEVDFFGISSTNRVEFQHKINNNYLHCTLLSKNIIDIEIYLTNDFIALKGSYAYDALPAGIKKSFESCQKLYLFLKQSSSSYFKISKQGLGIWIDQSGLRKLYVLEITSVDMYEKEIKQLVRRLIQQNQKLSIKLQKQSQQVNGLLDTIYKENQSTQKFPLRFSDQNQQNVVQKKESLKIPKFKPIRKDRIKEKQYPRNPDSSQQIIKFCFICRCQYEGMEYYKFCSNCYLRNRQFLNSKKF